ncbi:hypothetical protein GGI11_001135 [Coemansia sp. RSA 2049]|nr:hypothetical protein GGI11_001135 [Coemansia sp. RSA 2049]
MWARTGSLPQTSRPPAPPPSSAAMSANEDTPDTTTAVNSITSISRSKSLGGGGGGAFPLAARRVDADILADLLGSLEEPEYSGAADEGEKEGVITTQAVLDGLRSLDEFEQQAAVHTDMMADNNDGYSHHHRALTMADLETEHLSDSFFRAVAAAAAAGGSSTATGIHSLPSSSLTPSAVTANGPVGLGSFNEAELSAALEQIYWGSLDMPLNTTASATEDSVPSVLPTPPVSAPSTLLTTNTSAVVGSAEAEAVADESDVDADDYEEENDDDENPLELEELSLFSLFLSDMAAFETFLDNLSLNQLRQCAATVNSVLVRRESGLMQQQKQTTVSSSKGKRGGRTEKKTVAKSPDSTVVADDASNSPSSVATAAVAAAPAAESAENSDKNNEVGLSALPQPTLALLREWLPPSTADCVITALQSADLPRFDSVAAAAAASTAPAKAGANSGSEENRGTLPAALSGAGDRGSAAKRVSNSTSTSGSAEASSSMAEASTSRAIVAVEEAASDADRAGEPSVEDDIEGTPWLSFAYAQKGKPQRHRIRIDVERAAAIPTSFKQNNCVYPRANCARASYRGNRWSYETECNALGWKLAFLNQELLSDRRGLLQTAVNNYRTMVAGRKSRRITRMEKAERSLASAGSGAGTSAVAVKKRPLPLDPLALERVGAGAESSAEKRSRPNSAPKSQQPLSLPSPLPVPAPLQSPPPQQASQSAKCLTLSAYVNGKFSRIRINVDLSSMGDDSTKVGARFKRDHAVFPRALDTPRTRYGAQLQGRWEFEQTCNELAWRLAWLNRTRLHGRKLLVQRCIDAYRGRFAAPPWPLLSCHQQLMGGSVDSRFFDYWRPRPGRRSSLLPDPSPGSVSGSTTAPSSPGSSGPGSSARVRAIRPRSSVPVVDPAIIDNSSPASGSAAPPSSSSSSLSSSQQTQTQVHQKQQQQQPLQKKSPPAVITKPALTHPTAIIRPQIQNRSQPSQASTSRPETLGLAQKNSAVPLPSPQRKALPPAAPAASRPKMPAAQTAPKTVVCSTNQHHTPPSPATTTQPKSLAAPLRSPARPVSAPAPAASPGTKSSSSAALTKRTADRSAQLRVQPPAEPPKPAAPAASSRTISNQPKQQPQQQQKQQHIRPAPTKPTLKQPGNDNGCQPESAAKTPARASGKSAKAQAAANMLTDVLRQLSRGDPSLETLAGMLEKKNSVVSADLKPPLGRAGANAVTSARSQATVVAEDDGDIPLDAKVAELEKLIIDLQND